jgi:hypothetical protein
VAKKLMAIKMHIKKRNQILSMVLFICCAITVSWGIFRSTPLPEIFYQSDKALHIMAFTAMAFVGRMSTPMLSPFLYWPTIAAIVVSMEYVQGVLQITRTSSLEDAVANLMGIGLAFVVVKIVDKKMSGSE